MEEGSKKSKSSMWLWVVVLVIVLAGAMWWMGVLKAPSVATNGYQAVFLSNDQVYFGKLSNAGSQYVDLTDVFYLQVSQGLQPKDQNAPSSNINLVKLGGELHGPMDEMSINRDHILFFENLRSDSQVVKAINAYQDNLKKK